MAIQLNNFSKTGIISALSNVPLLFGASSVIRIFPSTVPFPASPINNTGSTPAGHILSYTGLTYAVIGNTIVVTAGTTTANASAAGTLTWWTILAGSAGQGNILSNSIGLSGAGAILTTNTLTPTGGQSVTITLNLTLA